ncbi:Very-long-chain 3-oxoacyl-CoA reductase [Rhizoctonia solani]|uniref:Very-long-chain 3-oxoacyl-CoA reductase n=1 Tax=Rhizoctonia solani TaxID=456999 RepID=A0A8H7IG51_9AGAM|nr:Very-long-chain 3-oxoacyl-CoA reductase [Rhizoctonia solani]
MGLCDTFKSVSDSHTCVALTLSAIGAAALVGFGLSFVQFVLQTFVLSGHSVAKNGAWAVVTGATDGIGREFASQLAKAGFNILIASRTQEKLDAFASELQSKYSVSTKTYAIDFARRDTEAYAGLATIFEGLDVGVLVNNVGKSHDIPADFHEIPLIDHEDIVEINVNATIKVTRLIVPGMITRRRGLILNLGSFAGAVPSPMLATYSGSKAFLSTWSRALAAELAPRGVDVQLVNTYFVVSSMSKIRRATSMIPLPSTYVRSVLSKIGLQGDFTTPYWAHGVLAYAMNFAPSAWLIKPAKDIRRRALKKREREAAAAKKETVRGTTVTCAGWSVSQAASLKPHLIDHEASHSKSLVWTSLSNTTLIFSSGGGAGFGVTRSSVQPAPPQTPFPILRSELELCSLSGPSHSIDTLFSLTIVRLNYTDRRRDPLIDPLRGGQAFYDPPIPELLVASFLTMCFALWMMFVIYRRYGHRILTKTWFELLWLFILWGLWLGGAASAAVSSVTIVYLQTLPHPRCSYGVCLDGLHHPHVPHGWHPLRRVYTRDGMTTLTPSGLSIPVETASETVKEPSIVPILATNYY